MRFALLSASMLVVVGCSGSPQGSDSGTGGGSSFDSGTGGGTSAGGGTATGGGTSNDAGDNDSGIPDSGSGLTNDGGLFCPHPLAPPDTTRKVVVSHPFPTDGGNTRVTLFEAFDLDSDGGLRPIGAPFNLGSVSDATQLMVFTPDGTVGIVPQDDGTLGVVRFLGDTIIVVHTAFAGQFYATAVLMDPSGGMAYVLDADTVANGGGIYEVAIGCDGALLDLGLALAGKTPWTATWLNTSPLKALVSAESLGNSPDGGNVHLVDFSVSPPVVLASAAGFPDTDAVPASISVNSSDTWVAVPDDGFAAGNRVAVLSLENNTLTPVQLLTASNPIGVSFSPFSPNALLITSDGTDAYRELDFASGAMPWSVSASTLMYTNGAPQLPGPGIMISRGALKGRVLVAELDSIRQLQHEADGGLTDVSLTPAKERTTTAQIIGSFGVAP